MLNSKKRMQCLHKDSKLSIWFPILALACPRGKKKKTTLQEHKPSIASITIILPIIELQMFSLNEG